MSKLWSIILTQQSQTISFHILLRCNKIYNCLWLFEKKTLQSVTKPTERFIFSRLFSNEIKIDVLKCFSFIFFQTRQGYSLLLYMEPLRRPFCYDMNYQNMLIS